MKKIILYTAVIIMVLLLLWQVNFIELKESVLDFPAEILAVILMLQLISLFLVNWQWYRLAKYQKFKLKLKTLISINLKGKFIESITPSNKAGGEITKIYLLKKKGDLKTDQAALLLFLQKIISTFTFIALNVLAIAYFIFRGSFEGVYLRVLVTIFVFAVTFILLTLVFLYLENKFYKFLKVLPLKESWKESLDQFLDNLRIYIKKIIQNPVMLREQLIISLSIWTLFALKAYLIVNAFGLELNFIEAALLTYLSYMAGMIPFLPGGIGSVETAVVFFLTPFGAAASTGLAVALILRFATFWFVFLLSFIYVLFICICTRYQNRFRVPGTSNK